MGRMAELDAEIRQNEKHFDWRAVGWNVLWERGASLSYVRGRTYTALPKSTWQTLIDIIEVPKKAVYRSVYENAAALWKQEAIDFGIRACIGVSYDYANHSSVLVLLSYDPENDYSPHFLFYNPENKNWVSSDTYYSQYGMSLNF